MKRSAIVLITTLFTLLSLHGAALACTSFAVYSPRPIYGMNFDYARFPMKLRIETKGELRTFHLAFEKQLGELRFFADTGGMNSKGLFYACQEQYPFELNPPEPGEGNLPLYLLNELPERAGTVKEIQEACNNTHLVQIKGVTIHTLFADMTGAAMVVETGETQNRLTPMTGGHIVMANFPNHTLKGKSHTEAKGCGDYRYKIAHEYLQAHHKEFTVDHGLALLGKAHNQNPEYPTTCSMVFAPETNSVYIAFHRDFSKVWRVSIDKGIIETFRGFQTEIKQSLDQDGLLVSELVNQALGNKTL